MRILNVVASVNPEDGGPVEFIKRFGEVLQRHGHEQFVVSLDPPDAGWVKSYPGEIHALGINYNPPKCHLDRFRYTPYLISWLKSNASKFDIVVAHGFWDYGLLGTWLALRKSKIPFVVFAHGMLDPWFRDFYPIKNALKQVYWLFANGQAAARAAFVVFSTSEEKRLAQNAFFPYRIRSRVIVNGTKDVIQEIDPTRAVKEFYKAFPNVCGKRFVLYLSRIHPKKGCDLLISAFARNAYRHPGVDLVIAGPDAVGWRRKLEKMAAKAGVTSRIHWTGMLEGEQKLGALLAAESFVLPSHQENFGIAVVEAMACSKPILITDKVNIWREIEKANAGLVVNDTLEGISYGLDVLLGMDSEKAREMGRSARKCFLEKFEIQRAGGELLAALQNLKQSKLSNKCGTVDL
jgi:glycosyltransferase involved in cell wall biosynthesis